jgi:hypothetical protein
LNIWKLREQPWWKRAVLGEHSPKFMVAANMTFSRRQRSKGRVMTWFLNSACHVPSGDYSRAQSSEEPRDFQKSQERKFQSYREKTLTCLRSAQDSFSL